MNMAAISPTRGFHRFGFFFLSLFCVLLLQSATGRKLKFVLLVMRHGDRTPLSSYPTDLYKENVWPGGYGQLTTFGMKQHYQLGEFLRSRYRHFLHSEYNRKEIYVRSSDLDRTIMSAQANLAGLFPPIGSQIWNSEIQWQPIPVHTVPRKDDKLLCCFPMHNCTRFKWLLKETMGTEKVKEKVKSTMTFFTELAGYTGYNVKTFLDPTSDKLWKVYDALKVQSDNSYRVPKWASPQVMKQMDRILVYALTAMFGKHKRKQKSRLQGGLLVKNILEKITKASQNTSEAKMIMYSTHDTTLVALQMALNVFDRKLPRYAACYFFELYQETNGEYTIEMYYRNSNYAEAPTLVVLPDCTAACPLEKFKTLLAPIIPDNWEEECNKL